MRGYFKMITPVSNNNILYCVKPITKGTIVLILFLLAGIRSGINILETIVSGKCLLIGI